MPKRKRHGGKKKKAIVVQPDDERDFLNKGLSRKDQKSMRVKVKTWQGEMRVDIRKHYESGGKDVPSLKGISLKVDEWNALKGHVDGIDEAIAENL